MDGNGTCIADSTAAPTPENDAPRRHLMDEWPYDPLPSPVAGICNAEYVIAGVIVGHCGVHTNRKGEHKGKHRIEWDTRVIPPADDPGASDA